MNINANPSEFRAETSARDTLFHWVREREAIRIKKERGDPSPWTDDPILRDYRFCNVRREDDRVTRWIAENIRQEYAGHEYLWFMLCAARMINFVPTLSDIIIGGFSGMNGRAWPDHPRFHPAMLGDALSLLSDPGLSDDGCKSCKIFGAAYIIPCPKDGQTKARFVADTVLGALWRDREQIGGLFPKPPVCYLPGATLGRVHERLMRYKGWGPFLAYQAVVDMRFTPLLDQATDRFTFSAAGPGTLRGLNRIHGRRLDYKVPQRIARQEIRDLYATMQRETGVAMDLSDIPNICCEVDKYLRTKNGEGTPKARYVPGRGC